MQSQCCVELLIIRFFSFLATDANNKWQRNIFVRPQKNRMSQKFWESDWLQRSISTEVKPTDWRGSRRTNTDTSDKSAEPLIRRSAVSVTGLEVCLPVVDNSAALKPSSHRAHCHIDAPITDHVAGD